MSRTKIIAGLVLVALLFLIAIKEGKKDLSHNNLKAGAIVLAFGDSLTYGFGAPVNSSYPSFLSKKSSFRVINAGVNGEVSAEGLLRLPGLLEQKPDLVILCHGGNDILSKLSMQELKNNLLLMIKLIRESGAEVILVGVPDFHLFGFYTHKIYGEVAKETGVYLEDEVLSYVESHRAYKSDYIHPNAKGYEMMADAFFDILKEH